MDLCLGSANYKNRYVSESVTALYDTIRYLFIAIGFVPGGSGPLTCT
jgi:hypothetical protein